MAMSLAASLECEPSVQIKRRSQIALVPGSRLLRKVGRRCVAALVLLMFGVYAFAAGSAKITIDLRSYLAPAGLG